LEKKMGFGNPSEENGEQVWGITLRRSKGTWKR
jgi:hypothetical protein